MIRENSNLEEIQGKQYWKSLDDLADTLLDFEAG